MKLIKTVLFITIALSGFVLKAENKTDATVLIVLPSGHYKQVPVYIDGKDYYQIFGISRTAKGQEIAKAFAKIKSQKKTGLPYGDIFDTLADSKNREQYDKALKKIEIEKLAEEFEEI